MIRLNKYLSEAGVCSRREADRLIEPGIVTVDGKTAAPGMKVEDGQEMSRGVHIRDKEKNLDAVTRPCTVKKTGKYTFSIILTQGLNRQIRRMCEALGYNVDVLKRIRIMNVELGDLKPGQIRELTEQELKELYGTVKERENAGISRTSE